MTTYLDIIARIHQIAAVDGAQRRQLFSAQTLAQTGDIDGATAIVDAIEAALHPAEVTPGGSGNDIRHSQILRVNSPQSIPDSTFTLVVFDQVGDDDYGVVDAPPDLPAVDPTMTLTEETWLILLVANFAAAVGGDRFISEKTNADIFTSMPGNVHDAWGGVSVSGWLTGPIATGMWVWQDTGDVLDLNVAFVLVHKVA